MIRSYESDFSPPRPDPREGVDCWLPENPALVPEAVAAAVMEEFAAERSVTLPRQWKGRLVARAKRHAATHPHFRRLLCRPEDESRDWLWTFMRHWLEAAWQRRVRVDGNPTHFATAAAAHFFWEA